MKKLRVAILSHGGVERVLKQLCELESVEVVGVFVETEIDPRRSLGEKIKRSILYDGYLETAKKILSKLTRREVGHQNEQHTVRDRQRELENLCAELNVPCFVVDSYHSARAVELLKDELR